MTEIRYWNTARTQDEILELMNFRLEELDCGVYEKGETCNETESKACHVSSTPLSAPSARGVSGPRGRAREGSGRWGG
eukprot:531807-Rhodomonas_salina.1